MLSTNINASTASNAIVMSSTLTENTTFLSNADANINNVTPKINQTKKKFVLFGHKKPVINHGGIYLSAGAIIIIVLLLILIL
jgi:hypothetical protein